MPITNSQKICYTYIEKAACSFASRNVSPVAADMHALVLSLQLWNDSNLQSPGWILRVSQNRTCTRSARMEWTVFVQGTNFLLALQTNR